MISLSLDGKPYVAVAIPGGYKIRGRTLESKSYEVKSGMCTCPCYQHRNQCKHVEALKAKGLL